MILQRLSRKVFEYYCRLVFTFYCPVQVTGRENLPEGPFVLCSNHSSHLDFILLAIYSGRGFSHSKIAVAKDYWLDHKWRRPLVKWFFEAVPIRRRWVSDRNSSSVEDTIGRFQRAMTPDDIIIIFPEGTRTTTGEMRPFKQGAGLIASSLTIPVVPAYMSGSFKAWPKGRYYITPGSISIRFGAPIYPGSVSNENFDDLVEEGRALTDKLFTSIKKMEKALKH